MPTLESLGRIFQAGGINQIELLYDKSKAADLLKPVSGGKYSFTQRTRRSASPGRR